MKKNPSAIFIRQISFQNKINHLELCVNFKKNNTIKRNYIARFIYAVFVRRKRRKKRKKKKTKVTGD